MRVHALAAALIASAAVLAPRLDFPALAQQPGAPASPSAPRALTADDYARAERLMGYNTTPLVLRSGVAPVWLDDDRFWYRTTTENGSEAFLIDAARRTRERYTPPPEPAGSGRGGRGGGQAAGAGARPEVLSPDGTRAVFTRDFNLWMRDVKTGAETALTTDGEKDFGYATNNAGWVKNDRPVVVWSPDSRMVATFQHDGRQVGDMYLVSTEVGHPRLEAWKYPLPGDEHIFTIHRVVIDTDTGRMVRLQMAPDPHRSTLCDHIVCGGEWVDVQWAPAAPAGTSGDTDAPPGGRSGQAEDLLAFASTSRDHKHTALRVAQAATGEVRTVLEETVETFFESGTGRVNWRVLPASNEVIWFSKRDNWGQLYLYDLTTGALKHQITSGEGNVTQLLHVDETRRQLYFLAVGKEPGRDPYFIHFYRIGFDGKGLQRLTPEDANHTIVLSPSRRYFVDTYSTPVAPPVSVLRDMTGTVLMTLERADITRLRAAGWQPPMPFTVKARDGVTDLYGLMYRPTHFDPSKKYPIINHIYPGPQTGSVGSRSFSPTRGDTQPIAELGFIVVQIDGMGTPWRSKAFHDAYYGNMGDNTLPDQIAGMRELAARHPWIDLERAGIYGHSGGGYAAAAALFRHPEFFKVGVSQAGNHDNRNYEDDWAEKWQGLLIVNPDGTTNYDNQANQLVAANLKGRLLLAHGTMDANVPASSTLLVVNALIAANKDFDLIVFPNRGHGFGSEPYMVRRRWDYFVTHLLGAEPPKEYEFRQAR
jgi:dipeptidyl-peptidase 4